MKTKEELNEIKKEVEAVTKKLRELTPDELEKVTGGELIYSDRFGLWGAPVVDTSDGVSAR